MLWGTAFLANALALRDVGPATVASGRIALGALVLLGVGRVAGEALPRGLRTWAWLTAIGVTGNALPFFLIGWGQQRVSSGVAGLLMGVMPLATLLLAHFFSPGERMTARKLQGFALGFLGILVLTGPQALAEWRGGESDLLRQLAVLAGALCYGVNAILARQVPATSPITLGASSLVCSAFAIAPVAFALEGAPATFEAASAFAVVWLGVGATAAATLVYYWLIQNVGATFVAGVNYLIPGIALASGALALGEAIAPATLAALVLVVSGLIVSGRT